MNEAGLLLYAASLVASVSLGFNGLKNHYLPIARPLSGLAFMLAIFCLLNFLELLKLDYSQWLSQFSSDLRFLLLSLTFPLWIWLMFEYQLERRINPLDKKGLIFLIHPLIQLSLVISDIFSNGFLSQEATTSLISYEQRIGNYSDFRQVYGLTFTALVATITPYLMIKKQQSSLWGVVQVIVYTGIPFALFALYRFEVITIRLAGPAYVLYLFWISRQYRMLDVMPVALTNILNNINSGMLVSDSNSKLLYINEYANELLDLKSSPQILQQRKFSIADIFNNKFDFSNPQKQVAQLEIRDTQQGKRHYIDATLQPIFNPKSKKHMGATVALHDVTERKQAELELQSFDRQKSEFFAGISHEFRTPLTLSLGNLDDVLNDPDGISTKELKDTLSLVKNNNKRLLNLVNQLLELSQLDAGSLQIKPTLLHLDDYLPTLIANFESLANKQNTGIHLHFDDELIHPLALYFDVEAFDKIILNLVSNALKSMPEGGDVYIQLSSVNDQYLQLMVRDTGCGIPTDALSKIFEIFYSHHNDNAAWPQGAGVGLSLVKQLLTQHGAEIDVSSIEGQGTTFTLNLHRGYAHFPEDVLVEKEPKHTSVVSDEINNSVTDLASEMENTVIDNTPVLTKLKQNNLPEVSEKLVLLADDNTQMRAYIRKHLSMNFRLLEAADGEEALVLARQTIPDLVLSDVMMPKMNGYDVCKQLKSDLQTSHIPVLLLTAKSSQTEKLEGLELGADDYLSKPFDVKELTLRMNNLISSRRIIKQFYQSNGLDKVIDNPALPKRETAFLATLRKYVEDNLSNTDIKVSDLAQVVFMSERSLGRKLKVLTGDTPKKMLLIIRLEQAKKLLRDDNESITRLCYSVGFSDASHFTRSFKAHYSMTPTNYRKQYRK